MRYALAAVIACLAISITASGQEDGQQFVRPSIKGRGAMLNNKLLDCLEGQKEIAYRTLGSNDATKAIAYLLVTCRNIVAEWEKGCRSVPGRDAAGCELRTFIIAEKVLSGDSAELR